LLISAPQGQNLKHTDKQQGQTYREVKHIVLDYVDCVELSIKYFYKYFFESTLMLNFHFIKGGAEL